MLDELDAAFSTLEFEETGAVFLDSVRWRGRACEIILDVRTGDDNDPRQAWRVQCTDARATRLSPGWRDGVHMFRAHPLLLPYTDAQAQLAFRGRPEQPWTVVGALWDAHRGATDGWFPFDGFLNRNVALPDLFAAEGGILAEGPRSVLDAYAQALQKCGLIPSLFGEHRPTRWLDGEKIPESEDVAVMIIGKSYVVGTGFEIARVSVECLDPVT